MKVFVMKHKMCANKQKRRTLDKYLEQLCHEQRRIAAYCNRKKEVCRAGASQIKTVWRWYL